MKGITGLYLLNKPNTFHYSFNTYNNKFPDDKTNYSGNDFQILFDGCLLNLSDLKKEYNVANITELVKYLWEKYDTNIIKHLKGSFVLVVYDIKKDKLFITNDRLSKRPLYYYLGEVIAFSSRFFDLVTLLKERITSFTPDKLGIAMILQNGFLWGNCTYIEEVLCLREYESILVHKGRAEIIKSEYAGFGSCLDSEEIALKRFDELFKKAITQQYRKNEECGYAQMSTLSGGMDSRAALLAAEKSGFSDIMCLTYAQSESNDFVISSDIAKEHNHEMFFCPLDTAKFLQDPLPRAELNEGMHTYYGSTGAYTVFHNISEQNYGIIHCGLLGGEQLGDQYPKPYLREKVNAFKACKLSICDDNMLNKYEEQISLYGSEDEVEVLMHARGCQNLLRMAQDNYEIFSPFMDEDVFEYLFSLPIELKYGRLFYCKWMNRFYPNPYRTTFFNATVPKSEKDLRYKVLKRRVVNRINNTIHRVSKMDMNPIAYWIESNQALDGQIDKIFCQELSHIQSKPALSSDGIISSLKSANRLNAISAMISLNGIY